MNQRFGINVCMSHIHILLFVGHFFDLSEAAAIPETPVVASVTE